MPEKTEQPERILASKNFMQQVNKTRSSKLLFPTALQLFPRPNTGFLYYPTTGVDTSSSVDDPSTLVYAHCFRLGSIELGWVSPVGVEGGW